MEVRITDVKKWAGRQQSVEISGSWPGILYDRLEWPIINAPRVTAVVNNSGGSILVEIAGEVVLEAECTRCVKRFALAVPFQDFQEYRSTPPGLDDDWFFYSGDMVDLDRQIADAVTLALPYAAVCDAACRGLCAQCGVDLNQETCTCESPPDSRWAGLAQWHDRRSLGKD